MQLICGMHRSGTSLVARLLHRAGADFGDPAGFHPADKWNPDGYFEQADVLRINIALVNGPLWKFSYFWLPSNETIRRRARGQAAAIRALARKYRRRIVKENRFCLTLDAWMHYGLEVSEVLIVFREPGDVARSLRSRNRIPRALAYRLWCQHYERVLAATRALRRRCLSYERLLAEPARELARALSFLGLPGGETAELVRDVVRPGGGQAGKPRAYPPRVAEIYRWLERNALESAP